MVAQSTEPMTVLGSRALSNARTSPSLTAASAASAIPAAPSVTRPAARRREGRARPRQRSIPDIDTLQENDLHIDAGRHLDHRLILLGPLDQIFRNHVAALGDALPEPTFEDLAGRQLVALPVGRDVGALEDAVGIRRKASPEAAREPGEESLGPDRKSTRLNSSH